MKLQFEVQSRPLDPLARGGARTAYLAGAGGCGMRGLATFLLGCGWEVWGADRSGWSEGDPLLQAGLRPLDERESPPPVNLAIRSAAVPEADAGLRLVCDAGARGLRYAELLGEMTALRPTVAVAGSHGKTTCTGWIAFGLRLAGLPAGYLVGGGVPQLGASADWGADDAPLVIESCEYARSFHHLSPQWAALVNVDAEHPDTYPGGLEEVTEAFRVFLKRLPRNGRVWAGPEAPDLSDATHAPWESAPDLPSDWEVGLPGHHNRRNAMLVAAVLRGLRVPDSFVRRALAEYRGAERRMEEVGKLNGAPVVNDYAHHPLEVAATLQALRETYPGRRLVVAFQPHQARRFSCFRDDFAFALDDADAMVLLPVFRARDPEELQPRSAELLQPLQQRRPRPVEVVDGLEAAERQLRLWCRPGDLLVCLGAGDVGSLARKLAGYPV